MQAHLGDVDVVDVYRPLGWLHDTEQRQGEGRLPSARAPNDSDLKSDHGSTSASVGDKRNVLLM